MKSTITFTNNITVENYNALRAAVDWIQVTEKRASIALQHSFYCDGWRTSCRNGTYCQ